MRLCGLFGIVLLVVAAAAQTTTKLQPSTVSMIQLIATPEKFDGKLVRVKGWIRLEFEESALYFSLADEQHVDANDALGIESIKGIKRSREELNGKYVLVEGIFRSIKDRGNFLPPYPGRLTSISRVEPLPDRAEIEKMLHAEPKKK